MADRKVVRMEDYRVKAGGDDAGFLGCPKCGHDEFAVVCRGLPGKPFVAALLCAECDPPVEIPVPTDTWRRRVGDRRPWPAARPPEAALSMAQQRARMLRATSSAEARAFLVGLRAAHAAALDAAEELYNVADRTDGHVRAEGNARAAGAKLAAARIDALFVAAAAEAGAQPPRRGIRGLVRRLIGDA